MSDELKGENMTEREIGRIRKKFILISTLSFFGVMFLMGGFIYLFSIVLKIKMASVLTDCCSMYFRFSSNLRGIISLM